MLTFTRGTEVEALSKRVVAEGEWVSAEVLETTAYTCTVKYGGGDEIVEETVPRMAVRPLPPPLEREFVSNHPSAFFIVLFLF